MREQVNIPDSSWNPPGNVRYIEKPTGGGHIWIARLAISVDGEIHGFSAWDEKKEKAIERVNMYLDQRCQCKHGHHPLCEIHGTTNG